MMLQDSGVIQWNSCYFCFKSTKIEAGKRGKYVSGSSFGVVTLVYSNWADRMGHA